MAEKKSGSEKREPLLIAAIDFGTTYSGSAYSFRHDYVKDPTKIYAREWSGGSFMSPKAPTCVLIRPDGKTLESFGFDAEDRYAELASDEEHQEYYFFKHFKMLLYDKKDLSRTTMLDDVTGKQLPAKIVFALAIKFLKDDLVQMSEQRVVSDGFTTSDIHWVLTVPAIWNDSAKQFMREAATDENYAAIPDGMLTIALEPEAASLYCRHLPVKRSSEKAAISEFEPGTKYIVVDAGGGTVDVSAHEIKDDNTLKELQKASGGDWGGTKVDKAFVQFFTKLTGRDVWTEFQQNHMYDYIDLLRDWEVKKRKVDPKTNTKVILRIPQSLKEIYFRNHGKDIKNSSTEELQGKIEFIRDKTRIDADLIKSFFSEVTEEIVTHLEELLRDPHLQGLATMLLVGGFSECKLLQSRVKETFPEVNLVIPDDAGLAVLKGAVIFGHSPAYVSERVIRMTYGFRSRREFDPAEHPLRTKTVEANTAYCASIFETIINIGESVKLNEVRFADQCFIKYSLDESFAVDVYSSTESSPKFTTEACCHMVGKIKVDLSDTKSGEKTNVIIRFYFGRTELEVEVERADTKEISKLCADCL